MIALQVNNISKKYGKKTIVSEFSLEVKKGETIALIGESGSGKSTILKMIVGFEKPTTGSIQLNGKTICSDDIFVEPENRKIAMVFPDHALFPHLSAEKNIAFALHKRKKSEKQEIVNRMLNLIGLEELRHHKPHQLSSGQLQRIALARSLAIQPQLLLLDEPLSKLDIMLKKKMREQIQQIINQTKTTTILVTHDREDAFAIADKVVVIKNGITQQIGTPKEIYLNPKNEYVAHFFGIVNTINGKKIKHGCDTSFGPVNTTPQDSFCQILVRPENLDVNQQSDDAITATILRITFYGQQQELLLELQKCKQHITAIIPNDQQVAVGQQLFCKLNTQDLVSWPIR